MTIARLVFEAIGGSGPPAADASHLLFKALLQPSDDPRVKALQSLMHEGASQFIEQQQRQAGETA